MSAQDQTSYLYGSNSVFIEELFEQYKENPGSVDASWQEFFADLGAETRPIASWFDTKNNSS